MVKFRFLMEVFLFFLVLRLTAGDQYPVLVVIFPGTVSETMPSAPCFWRTPCERLVGRACLTSPGHVNCFRLFVNPISCRVAIAYRDVCGGLCYAPFDPIRSERTNAAPGEHLRERTPRLHRTTVLGDYSRRGETSARYRWYL